MKKEVVEYTCDNQCGKSAPAENTYSHPRQVPLPKGWVRLQGRSNEGPVIDTDLCEECMAAVIFALLEVKLKK